jgi:hypothetical protein
MSLGEIFALRMELSAAEIPWWAAYPDGQVERFRSVSGSGIAMLISDYPRASLTVVEDRTGRMVPVTS